MADRTDKQPTEPHSFRVPSSSSSAKPVSSNPHLARDLDRVPVMACFRRLDGGFANNCLHWQTESARASLSYRRMRVMFVGGPRICECCDLGEKASGGVTGYSLLHAVIDLAVGSHGAEHAHQQKLGSCAGFGGSEFEVGVE